MNKNLIALCMAGMFLGATLLAQDDDLDKFKEIDKSDAGKTPSPTPDPQQNSPAPQEPTHVYASKWSTFDGKQKVAVLFGDVRVKNPQFTLNSDKLTVYFHKDAESPKKEPGAKKDPPARPAETPKAGGAAPAAGQGSGIDKLIAEGNVVVESDRPDPKGGPPVHYVGKGEKMVYTPATGEAILSGWPQIQQGANTMVATESTTVIYLYRDGTMHADGGHKMEIHDPGPDNPSPSPAPDKQQEVK